MWTFNPQGRATAFEYNGKLHVRSGADLYRLEYAMKDWVWTDPRLANPSDDNWTHFKLGTPVSLSKGLIVKMSHLPQFRDSRLLPHRSLYPI